MATARTPRSRWIEEGLRALAVGGPDAVRIEALAERIGVSKGGFYWHFDNRRALLEEMLDAWERKMVDEIIEQVEAGGGDPRDRLRRLFALAGSTRAQRLLASELEIRDWARREPEVSDRLRRVDNRRVDFMRSLFESFCPDPDEVEIRCLVAMSIFFGSHFVASDHGHRSRAEVLGQALERLLA